MTTVTEKQQNVSLYLKTLPDRLLSELLIIQLLHKPVINDADAVL